MVDAGPLSQFLNYGGLGLLAILCIVVLGYNAWSLNALVKEADARRLTAGRPLLLAQMGVSVIGLFAVGFGAIYLENIKSNAGQVRRAEILLDPWDEGDASNLPIVNIPGGGPLTRPIRVDCKPGDPITVRVNFAPLLNHRIQTGIQTRQLLLPAGSGAVVK